MSQRRDYQQIYLDSDPARPETTVTIYYTSPATQGVLNSNAKEIKRGGLYKFSLSRFRHSGPRLTLIARVARIPRYKDGLQSIIIRPLAAENATAHVGSAVNYINMVKEGDGFVLKMCGRSDDARLPVEGIRDVQPITVEELPTYFSLTQFPYMETVLKRGKP